jgi:aryl-phospho-beta-D-glucosidase BglC (GH1 family)
MGFDYVRLCLDPQPMLHHNRADELSAEDLGYLDAAVEMILDQGLAVDIDIHASTEFKQKLATQDSSVEEFSDYWRALARHYANLDSERVYFEILNEPEIRDRFRWYGIEAKVAAAIREGAPQNTIIATGARWSDNDDLVFVEPLGDPNVVYTFHFYESHIFTHQGATWGENYWHNLSRVPYPSTPENVEEAASQVNDPVHRLAVMRYGTDRWNAARIDVEIHQVAEWARKKGVVVICNEFGVYRRIVDLRARAAWINDVRTALEKYGIGWAMWDYSGGFGVVTRQNGQSVADEMTVRALGLTMPGATQ